MRNQKKGCFYALSLVQDDSAVVKVRVARISLDSHPHRAGLVVDDFEFDGVGRRQQGEDCSKSEHFGTFVVEIGR